MMTTRDRSKMKRKKEGKKIIRNGEKNIKCKFREIIKNPEKKKYK